MENKRLLRALLPAGLMMTTTAQLVTAQNQEIQTSFNQPSSHKLKASDKVLRPFAKVYIESQKLGRRPQTPGAEQPPDRPADTELQRVLEQQGLNAVTYNRIAASVNHNEKVRTRVIELIEEERGKS